MDPPSIGTFPDPGGDAPVVVLSHHFWRDRIGGNPSVIGKALRINGQPATIVGVMPNGFKFPFGDYFEMNIDSRGDTQVVWGEGLTYESPGSIWYTHGR